MAVSCVWTYEIGKAVQNQDVVCLVDRQDRVADGPDPIVKNDDPQLGVGKAELTEREEGIIKYRYGLTDGKAHTLEETGREFSLTRERIRQIEKNVLKRLSEYAHEHAADFRP